MQNGHRASRTSHSPHNAQRDDNEDNKRQFGQEYGVLIKEWRLLQRAVVVIDANDRVIHIEYVADQMHEPDYEPAIDAINRAVHTTRNIVATVAWEIILDHLAENTCRRIEVIS